MRHAEFVRNSMKASYEHTLAKSGGNPTLLQGPKIGGKPSITGNKPEPQLFVRVNYLPLFCHCLDLIHPSPGHQVQHQADWCYGY